MEGKATFLSHGGGEFRYIPALNGRSDWVSALAHLTLEHLAGWLPDNWSTESEAAAMQQTRQRAESLGAK